MVVVDVINKANMSSIIKKNFSSSDTLALALLSAAASLISGYPEAHAESVPERAEIGFKYLDYSDYQPDQDRVRIKAPSLMVMTPIAGEWSWTTTAVTDSVTGASPRYYDKQLTTLKDRRNAYTTSVTKYLPHSTYTLGLSYGEETDYISRGQSFQANFSSEDKNTTLTLGLGNTNDVILPNNAYLSSRKDKDTVDAILGVTQIFSPFDIGQITFRHSSGMGYYSDQYKIFDDRPSKRVSDSLFFRWNHHFAGVNGTLRSSYRFYRDDWKVKSHTLGFEYFQNLGSGWSVTPLIRYYSQNKAYFYEEKTSSEGALDYGSLYEKMDTGYLSLDQRLSSFGAVTYGVKVNKWFGKDFLADFKVEQYEQRGDWALEKGSGFISSFKARSYQVGIKYYF